MTVTVNTHGVIGVDLTEQRLRELLTAEYGDQGWDELRSLRRIAVAIQETIDEASDEGYAEALEDVEVRVAEMSKTVLWEASDLKNPVTRQFWNRRAQAKHGYLMVRAEVFRTAAKICERLRMDNFE